MRYDAVSVLACIICCAGCSSEFTPEQAGFRITFRVDTDSAAEASPEQLTEIEHVLEQRLSSTDLAGRFKIKAANADEINIYTPRLTDSQATAVTSLAVRPGTVEFAIVANPRDHAQLIAEADPSILEAPEGAAWIPLEADDSGQPIELGDRGNLALRDAELDGQPWKEILIIRERESHQVTEQLLVDAYVAKSGATGAPALWFELSEQGGYLMRRLTAGAAPTPGFRRRLGIILDGSLHSAPFINDVIGGQGVIEGDFTEAEATQIVTALRAGRLPARLELVEAVPLDRVE